MKRRLATLAAVASLVLCVATVALWVRSYRIADYVGHADARDGNWGMSSVTGILGIYSIDVGHGNGYYYQRERIGTRTRMGEDSRFGFGGRFHEQSRWITFPHWVLCIGFAALPLLRLWQAMREQRCSSLCRTCGYDLRATPARCPECGTERVLATDEHR